MRTSPDSLEAAAASSPMRRRIVQSLPLAACLVAGSTQSGVLMPVSATVAPQAAVSVSAPAALVISAADLARGYVEVAEPSQLRVVSNFAQGVALDVRAPRGLFAAMTVRGVDLEAVLPGEGGTIAFRWPAAQPVTHALSVALRFRLVPAPGVQPGTYAWPIQLQGRALETAPNP
jgi:hypothetical protein